MTRAQRSKVIEAAIEIDKLEARLRVLYQRLDELTGSSKAVPSTPSGNGRNGSYRAVIHAVLKSNPEQEVYSEEQLMSEADVSEDKKSSFRSTLSRLVKRNEINRVGPKKYSLKQEAEQAMLDVND